MNVRPATLEVVRRLNAQCFGEADEFSSVERLRDVLSRPLSRLFISRADGQIVGYNLVAARGAQYLEGLRIGVHRDYRRRGIASRLLRRSIQYARQLCKGYTAYVLSSNPASFNAHVRAGMLYDTAAPSGYGGDPKLWLYIRPPGVSCKKAA